MTPDHFDELETRDPAERERDFCRRLPALVARALRAPGWAAQLAGVDPAAVSSRAALARLPLLRKSDLVALQKARPPFGGFNVTPVGQVRRLLMSPGPIFEPEGKGDDAWGAARALYAAGFRAGDVVHNSFSYHLTPGGFIMESGAHALGCAVVPAGTGNTEQQVEAIAHFRPRCYLGTPDFLKILLDAADKAGKDVSSLKHALVSGAALAASLRADGAGRGVAGVAAGGAGGARRRRPPVLRHRRRRRHRLRERRRRGPDRQRDAHRRDRAPRNGRAGRGGRGRRHVVQPGLSDDPPRDRRP